MNLLKRFIVKKNERGLLFCEGDFVSILEPGVHQRFDLHNRLTVETFSLNTPRFEHRLAGYLRQSEPAVVDQYFERMDLAEHEVGLRFEDGALAELLPPGSRQLYWKGQSAQTLQRIDLTHSYRLEPTLLGQLQAVAPYATHPVVRAVQGDGPTATASTSYRLQTAKP